MTHRRVVFLGGPVDGKRCPQPLCDGQVAATVEVDLPPVYDSLLDHRPSAPAETHLYRLTAPGVYEWRGLRAVREVDLYRRHPRRCWSS